MTRIHGLRAENFKRLRLVDIEFPEGGGTFALMGTNEAGKSSTIDALEAAIAGRSAKKNVRPVHKGAEKAVITATFDDIIVHRIYKPDGSTQIKVTNREGLRFDSSEAVLKSLYDHVALDPLAFARMSDKDQVDKLLALIGFDPAPLDAEHDQAYAARTVAKRDVDAAKARADAIKTPPTSLIDAELVSVADLSEKMSQALGHNANINAAAARVYDAKLEVERFREQIKKLEDAVADRLEQIAVSEKAAETEPVDVEPIRAQIENAESTNDAIREAREWKTRTEEHKAAAEKWSALDARVTKAKADKRAALTAAAEKMPVPGLAIDEDGILTLDGTPFSQTSTGRQIKTGTAIAMALNPNLKLIVIRDASLLDAGNRAALDELARENGFVILTEIAGEDAEVGVILEDGMVRETRSAE